MSTSQKSFFRPFHAIYLVLIMAAALITWEYFQSDISALESTRTSTITREGSYHAEPLTLSRDCIVLTTYEYPPYVFSDDNRFSITTELVKAAFEAQGIQLEIVINPWERGQWMVDQGYVWGTFPYFPAEARREHFDFSSSIHVDETNYNFLFYNKQYNDFDDESFKTYEDLLDYKVGLMQNYWYTEPFLIDGMDYEYSYDEGLLFKKLAGGRIDLAPGDKNTLSYMMDDLNIEDDILEPIFFPPIEESVNYTIMVDKHNTDKEWFFNTFTEGMQKIQDNGTYDRLLDQFNAEYD